MKNIIFIIIATAVHIANANASDPFEKMYKHEGARSQTEMKCWTTLDPEYINSHFCTMITTNYQKNLSAFTSIISDGLTENPKNVLKVRQSILNDVDPELSKLLASKNIDPALDLAIGLVYDFIKNPNDKAALESFQKLLNIKDKYCFVKNTSTFYMARKIDPDTYLAEVKTKKSNYKFLFSNTTFERYCDENCSTKYIFLNAVEVATAPKSCEVFVW